MLEFESFTFEQDRLYKDKTELPLNALGLVLLRGKNYDASSEGKTTSNGSGKTRLFELLSGFIYGRNPRGTFKKVVGSKFSGTLKFKTNTDCWSFTYTPTKSPHPWEITRNNQPVTVSHKATDCQDFLQRKIGLTREEFHHFVAINSMSLDILIRGRAGERKAYLESFFNINAFYSQQFDVYNGKWKSIKDTLEVLKSDRIRLESVRDAQKDLPGFGWIEIQLEASDDALSVIKKDIGLKTEQQTAVSKQLDVWGQYHSLYKQLQGSDAKELKLEHDSLVKSKIELEQKVKTRQDLETFLKLKLAPHQRVKPKGETARPSEAKPDAQVLTDKGVALVQMRDKLLLKKQLTALSKEITEKEDKLESVPDVQKLETLKAQFAKQRMDAEDHYKLIQKGGDACPTCKQPLSFILEGLTPQERKTQIEAKIKEIQDQEKELILQLAMHSSIAKVRQQYAILKEQFDRFPTFGLKLSEAEAEVEELKRIAKHWTLYEKELELETQWKTKHDLLMVEANNLGYPDILNDDFSAELNAIKEKLPLLIEELKLFDRFDALADQVINLPSCSDLDGQIKEYREELAQLFSRVESLNELKGVLRTQLASITTLKTQAEALEKKLVGQEETESESKILELLNSFYSPTGFKVYELKRRCQKLIERANYWSKLFFQEPYEWSLSDDLDNLDFFIQPIHDRDTEPYPIALLSSGEFNRASRVLLFSQLELIPPSKKTNLLFLDEIEGNLDDAGMTAFCEVVLPKLKETFPNRTIVVISHQSSLQNSGVLDHVWLAERKDRKTALTVYPDYHRRTA